MPRGSRRLPDPCLRLLSSAELILHAGDFVAEAVLAELEELAPVTGVHGNMDEAALKARLPERCVVEAAGMRIGMVHDAGPRGDRADRLLNGFAHCDVIVYGHTHLPELRKHGSRWIVNPGSPTERRRASARTMALLHDGIPRLIALP